jgi:general transcription factor 3C polypeptide 2
LPFWNLTFQFIAVAAHPPGTSYHKMGSPLTGRGVIQIWCLLNVSINKEDVPPSITKPKQGTKNNGAMTDESTLKRPRGRPRKKPIEGDNEAVSTQSKRPRGRPRKNLIEKSLDNLDGNDQNVQALAVQHPEDSSELNAVDGVPGNTQEHAIQESSGKTQKRYKQAVTACNPALATPTQGKRLKLKKSAGSHGDNSNTSPLLLTQNEDMGSSVTNHQIQHNSGQEPAASDNASHDGSLGISSASFLISKDVALPRVVLCLAHNGKVAWDVKWRPSNACESKCKHRMGYLAVLLGNGSLEV